MTDLLLVLLLSIVLYICVLVLKTKVMFKKSKIKIRMTTSFLVLFYILFIHIKIALNNSQSVKYSFFVLKQFFVRYEVSLLIFIEVSLAYSRNPAKKTISNRDTVRNNMNSKMFRRKYRDMVCQTV